ncbi:hypothetical protein GCM10010976_08580 [Bizionia arctica]|uniref:Uncharacterized protein n=1 Tax=Bizionia arctica TaxID=1495645 RepID=A0A917GCX7_9FLAO|nr:hypothetical protein GCM10010976_08580 [Bizionia arctica]
MRFLNKLKWISVLSFVVIRVFEKLSYFEGFPTTESQLFKNISYLIALIFLIVLISEFQLKSRKRNRTRKTRLNDKN